MRREARIAKLETAHRERTLAAWGQVYQAALKRTDTKHLLALHEGSDDGGPDLAPLEAWLSSQPDTGNMLPVMAGGWAASLDLHGAFPTSAPPGTERACRAAAAELLALVEAGRCPVPHLARQAAALWAMYAEVARELGEVAA